MGQNSRNASLALAGIQTQTAIGKLLPELTRKGQSSTEVVYAITSLSPQRASAQQFLELNRGHWRIENQLHWDRDVVMGEDKCRARKGRSPQNLAALRNLGLSILRFQGIKAIRSTIRHFAMKPLDLLKKHFAS